MDYARPESKSTKTYTTWVTFDDQPDNKNYDENDFHPKFIFGRSQSMPTGHKSTPITISRKNSKICKPETESIFHQWANLENSNSNLENSFSNSLDSVATTSTPKSFSRQNSETSSFASSIGKKHALKNMTSLL